MPWLSLVPRRPVEDLGLTPGFLPSGPCSTMDRGEGGQCEEEPSRGEWRMTRDRDLKTSLHPCLVRLSVQMFGFRAENEELGQLFSEKHLGNSLLVQLRKELWEFVFCRNGVFN